MVIEESGMTFGDFDDTDLFYIEKSEYYQRMGQGVSTVEFILHRPKKVLFVEAKSSSPAPGNDLRFDAFIDEIAQKFIHSIEMYASHILRRTDRYEEMPEKLRNIDWLQYRLIFILVINGHKAEWLSPITSALQQRLLAQTSIWDCDISVINDEMAREYNMISNGG